MKCSLGIFAYNEEKNIGNLLEATINQQLKNVEIEEIFIIADGCTDKTVFIAQEYAKKDKRIKVLTSRARKGKAGAINLFLEKSKNEILVMESGDTIPEKNTVEKLLLPFLDSKVGMTGVRIIPLNNPKTFMGFTANFLWDLHHQISLKNPKMGEMVAFRKILNNISLTAVDEAYIEGIIKKRGYKIVYVPKAIVYNKGAENIKDFICQRRRIYWGHLHLAREVGYKVSTLNIFQVGRLIIKKFKFNLQYLSFTPFIVLLEIISRFLGWWDYKIGKKNHIIWKVAESTKEIK